MLPLDLAGAFGCRFHHLGLACRSVEREAAAWLALGYTREGEAFEDPIQRVRGCFLTGAGPRLELLMPCGDASPVATLVERGVKLYHQAFETPRLDDLAAALRSAGCKAASDLAPAVAFAGRRIGFFHMPNMNLLELIEAP